MKWPPLAFTAIAGIFLSTLASFVIAAFASSILLFFPWFLLHPLWWMYLSIVFINILGLYGAYATYKYRKIGLYLLIVSIPSVVPMVMARSGSNVYGDYWPLMVGLAVLNVVLFIPLLMYIKPRWTQFR